MEFATKATDQPLHGKRSTTKFSSIVRPEEKSSHVETTTADDSSSRIMMCSATPNNDKKKKRRPSKKKIILKSIKKIFSSGTSSADMSCSSSRDLSCAWTVINSLGTVSLNDDQDFDEDGYGNYEEYKGYSSSDFLDDKSSSSPHHERHYNHRSEKIAPFSDDSVVSCCSEDGEEGIVEDMTLRKRVTIVTSTGQWEVLDAKPLIARGKVYFRKGQYQHALSLYLQASALIKSIVCDHNCTDARMLLQDTTVEYEISKSKYALLNELSTTVGEYSKEDFQAERKIMHDEVQHGKRNVFNKTVVYYRDELLRFLGRCNKTDVSNLEQLGYILHLLHTLGDIHANKLARYSHALNYYNKALELEIEVFSLLEGQDESSSSMDDDALELKKRSITIQATRNKIGKIQYLTGRLDLALRRSFIPNTSSPR